MDSSFGSTSSTEKRGRSPGRRSANAIFRRDRSSSRNSHEMFLPKSSHIHVPRREAAYTNPDRITRFASPTRNEGRSDLVPNSEQCYLTSLSAVLSSRKSPNQDRLVNGISADALEMSDKDHWQNRRNNHNFRSAPHINSTKSSEKLQMLNQRAKEIMDERNKKMKEFQQELYDIRVRKIPHSHSIESQNTSDHNNSNTNSPYKGVLSPSRSSSDSVQSEPLGTSTPHGMRSGSCPISPIRTANGNVKPKTNGVDKSRTKVIITTEHVYEKNVNYLDLVDKYGDQPSTNSTDNAMDNLGLTSPSANSSKKNSLSATISNFFKKMSPRLNRKHSKASDRSYDESELSSTSTSSMTSPTHKSGKGKSPLSSPIKKLIGQSGRRSRDKSPSVGSAESATRGLLKSIGDQDKDVYHSFKDHQNERSSPVHKGSPRGPLTPAEQILKGVPPKSLNVRNVAEMDRKFLSNTRSAESIGDCSLDVNMTGSEPSIASGNAEHNSTLSKNPLNSLVVDTQPIIVKTATANSTSDLEAGSGTKASYVHLSCAVSGYGKYSHYTVKEKTEENGLMSPHRNKSDTGRRTVDSNDNAVEDENNDVFIDNRTQTNDVTTTTVTDCKRVSISEPPVVSSDDLVLEKDGNYFQGLILAEENKFNLRCDTATDYLKCSDITEEACGKCRAAIGKANLLTKQKFKQFRSLCKENLDPNPIGPKTTCEDLAGFWDLVMLQVDELNQMFNEIDELRDNNWKEVEKTVVETSTRKRTPSSSSQKSLNGVQIAETKAPPKTPKKTETPTAPQKSKAEKSREDARRRLMAAKRAARKRMASQSNDEVEIFVPDPTTN